VAKLGWPGTDGLGELALLLLGGLGEGSPSDAVATAEYADADAMMLLAICGLMMELLSEVVFVVRANADSMSAPWSMNAIVGPNTISLANWSIGLLSKG